MTFPLTHFQNFIDESILERGRDYFDDNRVMEVHIPTKGTFTAVVAGTENYSISISIEHGVVTEHNCDCPFDRGPICKHVVAVL
ncbi:MAG: hypothetical protein GC205_01490 [Bacteroidetes bacterium]|nr:hypothetical protein [Bacteroidota bacterium]